jgi:DnaJ-class molecular chaperone
MMKIRVRPDANFTRVGDDVRTTVSVPLRTALLGGEVSVPTPSGRRVSLSIPAETQNGKVMRLRGLGMPRVKGSGNGNLLAEVAVKLPLPMDDRTRELAQHLDV